MKFTKRAVSNGNSGSATFLKLKDGESITGVCRGEVYEFFIYWAGGKSHQVAANDPQGKPRFRVNFVTFEDNAFKPLVWEFGIIVNNHLADLAAEYDISQTKIKITRHGTGTDTVYMVIPTKDQPTSSHIKAIEGVSLNLLAPREEKRVKNYAPKVEDDDFGQPPEEIDDADRLPF